MGKVVLGIVIVILVLVVLAGAGYLSKGGYDNQLGGDGEESYVPAQGEDSEETVDNDEEENIEGITGGEVKEFSLNAERWNFTPSVITVSKGDIVKITMNNIDTTHGISLPDFGVSGNDFIEFTADKPGEYTFYCNNYCGEGHSGMTGKLIVQ